MSVSRSETNFGVPAGAGPMSSVSMGSIVSEARRGALQAPGRLFHLGEGEIEVGDRADARCAHRVDEHAFGTRRLDQGRGVGHVGEEGAGLAGMPGEWQLGGPRRVGWVGRLTAFTRWRVEARRVPAGAPRPLLRQTLTVSAFSHHLLNETPVATCAFQSRAPSR